MGSTSKPPTQKSTSNKEEKSLFGRKQKFQLSAIIIGFLAFIVYKIVVKENSPIVQTNIGALQGTVGYSRVGRPYYEYVGIPYATPPLGDLRFEV